MPTIVMQLSTTLDDALRAPAAPLPAALRAARSQAVPLFDERPAADDQRVWYLEVPEAAAADTVTRLLATPGVASAYLKPDDAPAGAP